MKGFGYLRFVEWFVDLLKDRGPERRWTKWNCEWTVTDKTVEVGHRVNGYRVSVLSGLKSR